MTWLEKAWIARHSSGWPRKARKRLAAAIRALNARDERDRYRRHAWLRWLRAHRPDVYASLSRYGDGFDVDGTYVGGGALPPPPRLDDLTAEYQAAIALLPRRTP